jgi:hypothetical protein
MNALQLCLKARTRLSCVTNDLAKSSSFIVLLWVLMIVHTMKSFWVYRPHLTERRWLNLSKSTADLVGVDTLAADEIVVLIPD